MSTNIVRACQFTAAAVIGGLVTYSLMPTVTVNVNIPNDIAKQLLDGGTDFSTENLTVVHDTNTKPSPPKKEME